MALLPRLLRFARTAPLALALLAFAASARAETLERIFVNGNEAYFHGQYEKAATQYQRLVDAGVRDADVYFDLALAHARLGQLGAAVLELERALWLRPGDDTTEQELEAARAALGRRRAEREGQATVQARPPLVQALVRPLSADFLAALVLALDLFVFGLLLSWPRLRRDATRLGVSIALPLLGLLLLCAGIGLVVKTEAFRVGTAAIVVRDGAELREGPDPHAEVRANAHEGQPARLLRREGSFARVELEGGERGWIASKDVGAIRPD